MPTIVYASCSCHFYGNEWLELIRSATVLSQLLRNGQKSLYIHKKSLHAKILGEGSLAREKKGKIQRVKSVIHIIVPRV